VSHQCHRAGGRGPAPVQGNGPSAEQGVLALAEIGTGKKVACL
jgi:hypothetical protein